MAMQWADLSAYENAKLKAVVADGTVRGALLDMRGGVDRDALEAAQEVGFVRADKSDYQWFTRNVTKSMVASLVDRLPEAQVIPFDGYEHFAWVESIDDLNTQRDTWDIREVATSGDENNAEVEQKRETSNGSRVHRVSGQRESTRKQVTDVGVVAGVPMKELRGNGDALFNAIAGMTPEQVKANIDRDQIWPPLAYKDLAKQGYEPGAVYLIKRVRDDICPEPGKRSRSRRACRPATRADVYAHAVQKMRSLMMGRKTLADATQGVLEVAETFWDRERIREDRPTFSNYIVSPLKLGADEAALDRNDCSLEGVLKRPFWQQVGRRLLTDATVDDTNRQAFRDILDREASIDTADNTQWLFLPRNHPLRTGASNELSETEKERRRAEQAQKPPRRVPRMALEDVQRVNVGQWRANNKDVSEMEVVSQFDLRGIEFGNAETQRERQALMNLTYDAFMDLAQTLGVDSRVFGLGGRLGLCFGSRGRGGPNPACAHFEPINFAINLTRHGGAGSLAHEWAHALDRSMVASNGMKSRRDALFASDAAKGERFRPVDYEWMTVSNNTADNHNTLMATIRYEAFPEDPRELTGPERSEIKHNQTSLVNSMKRSQNVLRQFIGDIESWPANVIGNYVEALTDNLRNGWLVGSEYADSKDDAIAQALDTLGVARRLLSDDQIEELETISAQCASDHWEYYDRYTGLDLVGCETDERKRQWILDSGPAAWQDRMRAAEGQEHATLRRYTRREHSKMYSVSDFMDFMNDTNYWSAPTEMFARSFECYVKHRLEENDSRNDFLVAYYKPSNANGETYGSVYPTGEHLKAVAGALNNLFDGFQQEKKESPSEALQGRGQSIILYSRDGDSMTGLTPKQLRADMLCRSIGDMLGPAVDVKLVDSIGRTDDSLLIAGQYDLGHKLLKIAMDAADPEAAGYHEALHGAFDTLFTEAEQQTVEAAFIPGGRHHKALEQALVNDNKMGLLEEVRSDPQEAAAYGFQYWMRGVLTVEPETRMGKLFERVRDFVEAVKNKVHQYGFQTAEDVFTSLADGEMRTRGPMPSVGQWLTDNDEMTATQGHVADQTIVAADQQPASPDTTPVAAFMSNGVPASVGPDRQNGHGDAEVEADGRLPGDDSPDHEHKVTLDQRM